LSGRNVEGVAIAQSRHLKKTSRLTVIASAVSDADGRIWRVIGTIYQVEYPPRCRISFVCFDF
jgi:hypothetical protein